MMKKYIALFLVLVTALSLMAGCAKEETPEQPQEPSAPEAPSTPADPAPQEQPVTVRLAGLKGPTTIGMVKLLDDAENKLTKQEYSFQMAAAADQVAPLLLKGELDILSAPANLAAKLYNNSKGAVKMLAVNTLGVVYIVDTDGSVSDIKSLKGKTIYATGKNTTPEYALRYLLQQHGLNPDADVTLEFKNEPTEVVAQLKKSGGVAMLPQPFVTVAQGQVQGLRIALDLTAEWDALGGDSRLVTACLMVRSKFAEEYPNAVATFLGEYADSTKYVNENTAEAAKLVEKFDIVKAAVAEKAIPKCNIVCITGADMKTIASGYLQTLFDANATAIGDAMPGDDFYYGA